MKRFVALFLVLISFSAFPAPLFKCTDLVGRTLLLGENGLVNVYGFQMFGPQDGSEMNCRMTSGSRFTGWVNTKFHCSSSLGYTTLVTTTLAGMMSASLYNDRVWFPVFTSTVCTKF